MSIWDSILRIFGQSPKTTAPSSSDKKNTAATKLVLAEEEGEPTTVPVDPFIRLFDKQDQHITSMLNSITLSTDMKTLYLLDNGRAIAYDLTVPQGIVIGLLGDQLVVATARVKESEDDNDLPDGRPETDKVTVKAGANSQFTLVYNEKQNVLSVIGFDDIILHLTNPDSNDTIKDGIFEIGRGKIVKIKREEETITLERVE
ncbi:MAG: hypothetical protein AAGJ93_11885 [Bacteroidota bacterium]